MMTISKPVGKNAPGQTQADITLVQTVLAAIKDKKGKAYYQGKIDGKTGPGTVGAIECFQLDNGIKVTGKVETCGPTMNRLRMKTPLALKNTMDKSGGGGHGADGCTDKQMIVRHNKKLADEIKAKWPLPQKAASELATAVEKVSSEGMVPLTADIKTAVTLDGCGNFYATLAVAKWGYNEAGNAAKTKAAMMTKAQKIIAQSASWAKCCPKKPDCMSFQATPKHPSLKMGCKPSEAFFLAINYNRNKPVQMYHAWLAELEIKYWKNSTDKALVLDEKFKKLGEKMLAVKGEKVSDVLNKLTQFSTAIKARRAKAFTFMTTKIDPALTKIGVTDKDVSALLLATGIVESALRNRDQQGSTAAKGLFQVETGNGGGSDTHRDNWKTFLNYNMPDKDRKTLREKILTVIPNWQRIIRNDMLSVAGNDAERLAVPAEKDIKYSPGRDFDIIWPTLQSQLRDNDDYNLMMAYVKYYRNLEKFPSRKDRNAMAQKWATIYNTAKKPKDFTDRLNLVIGTTNFP